MILYLLTTPGKISPSQKSNRTTNGLVRKGAAAQAASGEEITLSWKEGSLFSTEGMFRE